MELAPVDKKMFKSMRREIGYSQVRLAAEMGLYVRTISRYETGELDIPRVSQLAMRYIFDQFDEGRRRKEAAFKGLKRKRGQSGDIT